MPCDERHTGSPGVFCTHLEWDGPSSLAMKPQVGVRIALKATSIFLLCLDCHGPNPQAIERNLPGCEFAPAYYFPGLLLKKCIDNECCSSYDGVAMPAVPLPLAYWERKSIKQNGPTAAFYLQFQSVIIDMR